MPAHASGAVRIFALIAALSLAACGGDAGEGSSIAAPGDAAVAGRRVPTTFAAEQGRPFREPPVLASSGGVLRTTFSVRARTFEVAGAPVRGLSFTGTFIGPTLRLKPGDTLEITLKNDLADATNFHTHGFFTSPVGISDNVLRTMKPGSTSLVRIRLPSDISPGTYWYHTHLHGLTEEQVFGGLSGAIIVDGLTERLPEDLRSVPDRLMVLKDLQVKDGAIPTTGIDSNAPTTRTVNGLVNPVLRVRTGQAQLLRIGNQSADIWYRLRLDGARFHVIAEDANPAGRVWTADELIAPPGKRFDVLVRWDRPGTYRLRTLKFSTGPDGDDYPARTLASIAVGGAAVTPVSFPASMGPSPDLGDAQVTRRRTLVFGENAAAGAYYIDGKPFDPDRVNQYVKLGALEEWRIVNNTKELHPFHIHVNEFQVMSVGGRPVSAPNMLDTVPLSMGETTVIRIRFRRFTGTFVYHCHILAHEDAGMMGTVRVTRSGIRPPGGGAPAMGGHDMSGM